jgi:hypothetical protein
MVLVMVSSPHIMESIIGPLHTVSWCLPLVLWESKICLTVCVSAMTLSNIQVYLVQTLAINLRAPSPSQLLDVEEALKSPSRPNVTSFSY